MATISVIQKAPILDQDGTQLTTATANVSSSNPSVLGIEYAAGPVYAVGLSAGTSTLHATRLVDGGTSDLEVTVTNAAPFAITLGEPVAK